MTTEVFKDVREEALKIWRDRTDRKSEDEGPSAFVDAFECRWQENHAGDYHNNFFCSLGEFATNIDDLLEDQRYDDIEIINHQVNDQNSGKLYRYYCRVLLVADQVIEDFEKALKISRSKDKDWLPSKLKKFINEVVKHRSDGKFHFHQLNDHMPFLFEGIQVDPADQTLLSFDSFTDDTYDVSQISILLMPHLKLIIEALILCYERLDDRLKDKKFREKLNKTYCKVAS